MLLFHSLLCLALAVVPSLQQDEGASFNQSPSFNKTLLAAINAAAHARSCNDCYSILNIIKPVAELGDDAFAELSVPYCQQLHQYSPDACQGLETLEAPSVAYALRSMDVPSRAAQIFCNSLYGLCPQPPPLNYTVPVSSPKPANAVRPAASKKDSIYVVHISDLHVDHKYTVGASYNCSESICCRPNEETVGNASMYAAGPYGEHYCDSPVSLEQSQFDAIDKFVPKRAFTISTGDIVEGAIWETTNGEIVSDVTDAYTCMRKTLGLVYPAIGNHDANPVNSFPPAGVPTNYTDTYDYTAHSALWSPWIGPDAASQVINNYGSYSVKHANSPLRIISINTMFFEGVNWWIYNKTLSPDPSGIFTFHSDTLSAAEAANERVWIIGHIPPGRPDFLYDYSVTFNTLVTRFSHIIAAMFWGHTHRDQFEITYSDYTQRTPSNAEIIGYIAPSLTPTSGNPNFRVYEVDPVTFGIRDIHVYFANASRTDYQTHGPKWEKYYSAKKAYAEKLQPPVKDSKAELTPSVWSQIVRAFQSNDSLFQEYYSRKQRGWEYVPCEGSCKSGEICQLGSAVSAFACLDPLQAAAKRDLSSAAREAGDECGVSTMRDVMRAMGGDLAGLRKRAIGVLKK